MKPTAPFHHGALTDVSGIRVGHYQRTGRGWLTGTTVVMCGPTGAHAGVDVRGGGPGTRETDVLRPENLVQRVHALCLTGGSAYGLRSADGVMDVLAERRVGFAVGSQPDAVVPIVPAAVIFDLGRGGVFSNRPSVDFGRLAAERARRTSGAQGRVGAGTGAVAGGLKGGVGEASARLDGGITVAALMVANPVGTVIDPTDAMPYHRAISGLRPPSRADRRALTDFFAHRIAARTVAQHASPNTVIGVVATDARLTKSECHKVAQMAHDGIARAVRPAHTMFDGDTIFVVATGNDVLIDEGTEPAFGAADSRPALVSQIGAAAADVVALATTLGVLHAAGTATIPAYRDLCPTAYRDVSPIR